VSDLGVPKALGDFLVLPAVRDSGGAAVSVAERDMMRAGKELAETEGLFVAP
jgi:threonine synthase